MKKIFLITSIFMAIGGLFASCEKNTNREQPNCSSITVNFCLDDDEGQTKSSSTASLDLDNGCSVAFYSQSNGSLLETGSCEGSSRKIVITNVPDEDCNVYCVGNTTFSWPASETDLTTQSIDIDVTKGSIPRSTLIGDYTWSVGTSTIKIKHMPIMYVPLRINKYVPNKDISFVAESARISSCPNKIYPFNSTAEGTTGEQDEATENDIDIFNEDEYFVLYVPSNGETKVELTGTRHTGDGINYTDTYTLTVPALDRENENSQTITVNGENTGNQIVIIIGEADTRRFVFGKNQLVVKPDGQTYSTYVKGIADNNDKDWTYTLSWTGNTDLSNTYISVAGSSYKSLATSGSISNIQGDAYEKAINIYSIYSGSSEKYVTLTASVAEISKTMSVKVKNEEFYLVLDADGNWYSSNFECRDDHNVYDISTYYLDIQEDFYVIYSGKDKFTITDDNGTEINSEVKSNIYDGQYWWSFYLEPDGSNNTSSPYEATLAFYDEQDNLLANVNITQQNDVDDSHIIYIELFADWQRYESEEDRNGNNVYHLHAEASTSIPYNTESKDIVITDILNNVFTISQGNTTSNYIYNYTVEENSFADLVLQEAGIERSHYTYNFNTSQITDNNGQVWYIYAKE